MDNLVVQGIISSVKTMKDGGVRIQFDTQELDEVTLGKLMAWANKEFLTVTLTKEDE